ncbi:MAG: MFS transporter [Fusobacteriaceae bacterium]
MKNRSLYNSNLIILGNITSRIGTSVFSYINQILITTLFPKNPLLLSFYLSSENIINIIFNLFAGAIIDNSNRKRILIITDIFSSLTCFIGFFFLKNSYIYVAVLLTNLILSLARSFNTPVYNAIVKDTIDTKFIEIHYSRYTSLKQLFSIISPMIGFFIWQSFGISGGFLFNGVSFLLSAILENFIIIIQKEKIKIAKISVIKNIYSGFKYLIKEKQILNLISFCAISNFLLSGYFLILPYLNNYYINNISNFYGKVLVAQSLGSIIFSLLNLKLNLKNNITILCSLMICSGLSIFFIPIFNIFFNQSYIELFPHLLYGGFMTLFDIKFFSMIQSRVDHVYIGRIMSIIFTGSVLFMPAGSFLFGKLLNLENVLNLLYYIGFFIVILSIFFKSIYFKKEL